MASVGTSIVPPGPRPPPADTPGTSAPITTPRVTVLHHDFAVSLALGERANAQLKAWKILAKLRCCPWRAGKLAKAIHVLQLRAA